jgi:hypothetical protein
MILALSGKIGVGKDTVGEIIQKLTISEKEKNSAGLYSRGIRVSPWQIKKFADKLKDMVCILLSCSRQDLENRDFKEKELGEEWKVYFAKLDSATYPKDRDTMRVSDVYISEEAVKKSWFNGKEPILGFQISSEILTVRKILKLLGTECVRDIIHPDAWCNALMSEYKPVTYNNPNYYPNFIITDMRFENEYQAVKNRNGICIRIERKKEDYSPKEHVSETSLDHITDWDYVIDNNSTVENLIEQVKNILIKEKIINYEV